ncbi:putative spermidine/putrescine transport system permease protein [Roseovarius lutimaris]|uniref:Putative spermidine/putrescine transport system permease protein n=1 Tax=Roseovarius lutimaris TaxID=1005928 RepID=A0A1I5GYD9_9RHOB|nr:ABC transporter permease [Roseovarius lutimaris]SFO40973.1 putative spermidine/putrescine transport system permease protein [Roseovarius lutimaris]
MAQMAEDTRERWLLGLVTLLFFVFLIVPIVVVVMVSFTSATYVSFPIEGVSLRWFYRIVEYEPFANSLWVTLKVAFMSTVIAVMVGVPAALYLVRAKTPATEFLMALLLSPLSMPMIVLGLALLFYFSAIGLGISLMSLIVAHTVVGLPYVVRTVAGVYRSAPPDLEESAVILGATRWQIIRYVVLPQIRPGIFSGAMFSMLVSIDNLPVSFFFGSPSTSTLPVVMLSYLEHQFDPSIAAISTVQMSIALIGLVFIERVYGLKHLGAPA